MPRSLTPQDAYSLINLVVKEATGQNDSIQAVDASSFASVGDFLLAQGTENVLNALSRVLGRTFMAVRPYDAKFRTITSRGKTNLESATQSGVKSKREKQRSYINAHM